MMRCCDHPKEGESIGLLLRGISFDEIKQMMKDGPVLIRNKSPRHCDCWCHKGDGEYFA